MAILRNKLSSRNAVHILVRVCGISFSLLSSASGIGEFTLRKAEKTGVTPYVAKRLLKVLPDLQPELAQSTIGRAVYSHLTELLPEAKPLSIMIKPKLLTPEPREPMAYINQQLGITQAKIAQICGISVNLVGKLVNGDRRALSYYHETVRLCVRYVLRMLRRDYPTEKYHIEALQEFLK